MTSVEEVSQIMGNFQAITIQNDQRVKFTGNAIEPIESPNTEVPTIEKYYTSILKAALTTFKLRTELTPNKEQEATDFEEKMKSLCKGEESHNFLLIGYVEKDTNLSKNLDTLLDRIADEENKYYWKWLEGGNEVKDAVDTSETTILNQLRIVNVRLLDRIFINTPPNKIGGKHWIENEKPLQDKTLVVPAIAISPVDAYTHNGESYHGVYVNPSARLLFLDNSENTQKYKYGKKAGTNYYETQRTYKYNLQQLKGKVLFPISRRNPNEQTVIGETTEGFLSEYFLTADHQNYRYLNKLKQEINKLTNKYNNSISTNINIKTINGTVFEDNNNSEDKLLKRIDFKNKNNAQNQLDAVKTEANAQNQLDAVKTEAKEKAEADAREIPLDNYHCFYHDNNGTLMGHISCVHIGEGGRGGSGYPMRADKVNEVNYRWLIALPNGDIDFCLAHLWGYLFELDPKFLVPAPPEILQNQRSNSSQAFYPTNWPYNKVDRFGDKCSGMESWIKFYKTFNKSVPRRNEPRQGSPFPPRVTNPEIADYDYKFDIKTSETSVKLNNTSYRVWKKINSAGKELTLGFNEHDRADAGKTMAEALRDFQVYTGMKSSNITPKITNSKLSATAFAKYVLELPNDDAVKTQWRLDNKLGQTAIVNASSLKTDQEWCHLFGHGDGGSEELGNFVSGSKHCNTEQLAIETGQRRVSQNETDFTEDERNKLKARITAYLIPNAGTWVSGGTYTDEELNKNLLVGVTEDDVKSRRNRFFEGVDGNPNQYQLKDENTLRTEFKSLSDEISNKLTSTDKKKQLFQFRHNLENNFFMYLPIARWMRYKLYYNGKKVFDHIYDAQSESMNLHECQILDYTVERELYKATGKWEKYKEKIKKRVKNLFPIEEEVNLVKDILEINDKLNILFNNFIKSEKKLEVIQSKIQAKKLGKLKEAEKQLMNDQIFIGNLKKKILELKQSDLEQIKSEFKKLDLSVNPKLQAIIKDLIDSVEKFKKQLHDLETDNKQKIDQIETEIKNVEPNEPQPDEMDVDTEGIKIDESLEKRKRIRRPSISEDDENTLKRRKSIDVDCKAVK